MPRRQAPGKIHGGKWYLAPEIVRRIPPHTHYVEPYCGMASVLLAKPDSMVEGHSEVISDKDESLMNFWGVLRCPRRVQMFCDLLQLVPFSKSLFERARCRLLDERWGSSTLTTYDDSVWWAVDFFIVMRQSRQGLRKDFATLSQTRTRGGMNEQVSSWLGAIDGLLDVAVRMRRVVSVNDDALTVIRREDTAKTFFYIDPPYLHETRTATAAYGENEMTSTAHSELLQALCNIEGKFLLSGYPSEAYDNVAKASGWNREEILIDNKSSSSKKKAVKTEVLWSNYQGKL